MRQQKLQMDRSQRLKGQRLISKVHNFEQLWMLTAETWKFFDLCYESKITNRKKYFFRFFSKNLIFDHFWPFFFKKVDFLKTRILEIGPFFDILWLLYLLSTVPSGISAFFWFRSYGTMFISKFAIFGHIFTFFNYITYKFALITLEMLE